MLIDWFTVGAQALNFVILVWLMRRFLYKPILLAIEAREKRIAGELAEADARQAEAQTERDELQHKNEVFDQERAALLRRATDEAKGERQQLVEAARAAADAVSAQRQQRLRDDASNLNRSIRRRAQQEVFAIARKALAELATTSLEERLSDVFTRRLRALGGPEKDQLAGALATGTHPALVRSAFELPPEQRAAIQYALNTLSSAEVRVQFDTTPELISGIELSVSGQKVAWSIADYLTALEKSVAELLDRQVPSKPALAVESERKLVAGAP
jgi:F-type H+-transporting ATPase subunit b